MNEFTVTVIDTSGIQNYIFNSNNLQHNVGASGLVHCATHDWVFEELVKIGKTNIEASGNFKKETIEDDKLYSELVYAGGGNTVILFRKNTNTNLAKQFTINLTRRILIEAPGLQLIIAHKDFNWGDSNLAKIISDTVDEVNKKKYDRYFSSPLLGLGVTANCQYTGLPAVNIRAESERDTTKEVWISREVDAKWNFFFEANKRLQKNFPLTDKLKYISNFNDFGVKHESSYIAVVHTDGNNMGTRVQKIADTYGKDNRKYVDAIRKFSKDVEENTRKALKDSINQLLISEKNGKISEIVEIHDNKFPFRPIIFGGDDVTFVCDGRLGLTQTEFYLRRLASPDLKLSDGNPIFARAGIVIVKSHYPFSRAVSLADDLAKSAKKYIIEQQNDVGENLLAMDWHFASSGPIGNMDEIREREYTVNAGKLIMRPLRLDQSIKSDWRSWNTFIDIMEEFLNNWGDKQNKLMSLRDALRAGPEAVEQFVRAYVPKKLPEIKTDPDSATRGWIGDRCTCFDAIEAMDFFVPIERGGK